MKADTPYIPAWVYQRPTFSKFLSLGQIEVDPVFGRERKQQLGFSVCQKLLDLVVEHPSDKKLEAILRVCTSILTVLPLNGVRPMLCMDALSTVLRSPSHRDGVYTAVIFR